MLSRCESNILLTSSSSPLHGERGLESIVSAGFKSLEAVSDGFSPGDHLSRRVFSHLERCFEALIDRSQGLAGNCYGMAAFPLLDLHRRLVLKQHQGNSLRITHCLATCDQALNISLPWHWAWAGETPLARPYRRSRCRTWLASEAESCRSGSYEAS